MRTCLFLLLLALPTLATTAQVNAPVDSVQTLTEIELADGSVFVGTVISESDTDLVIRTSAGTEVRVVKSQIVSRKQIRGRVVGEAFRRFDPNDSRLFFAPTGRTLEQGSAYLTAYYIFFGFAAYGITDRVTLGGGTFLVPQAFGKLLYVAPKVQLIQVPGNSVSVGVLAGFAERETAGIAYAVWTKGQPDRSLTAGVGFAFGGGNFNSDPVIVLGGETRLGRRTKLVGEAYIAPTIGGGGLFMGGIRFFGRNIAADIGLLGFATEDGGVPAIPWVSFAYNFGR
ncbi:MAG: hypothetical protein ACI9W4_003062 [Rhodothermales bacterium]|jgi:hypothetical protein